MIFMVTICIRCLIQNNLFLSSTGLLQGNYNVFDQGDC